MNKKITAALIALLITVPTTANAAFKKADLVEVPTIAVLDTALDSTLPIFSGKIAAEVCLLDWNSCPNGTSFMEGPGAANLPKNIIETDNFNHGTQMASVAIQNNPNIKIVFIRIIGNTPDGRRQLTYEKTVYNALNWVYANKTRLNIKAVTMSQGHHNLGKNVNYCPSSPKTQAAIQSLISVNVPTFFPAGNGRDYTRIDWPSCLDESVSIGGVTQENEIATYSNYDQSKLDFYALGSTTAWAPGGVQKYVAGTSAAVQIAAAQWVALTQSKPSLSYSQVYALFAKTSKFTNNSRIPTGGKLIDLGAALNG